MEPMTRITRHVATIALVTLVVPLVTAQESVVPATDQPKLVLVLSGGGARGTAHVGVLRALEELRIAPDLIVGTSMGSIVGGLYAAGWSPDEMEALLSATDWNEVFSDEAPRSDKTYRRKQDDRPILIQTRIHFKGWKPYLPAGILGGQNLELLMDALQAESTTAVDLDDLNIPFRAVAADLGTGEAVVLRNTSLANAMRASMSIAGVFAPVELDGRRLVDGAAVANLPIGVARDLGATSIIAVDISTPLDPDDANPGDFLSIINRNNSVLTAANRDRDIRLLGDGDVLIQPDLGDITFADFSRSLEAVASGAEATRAKADELLRYSLDDAAWRDFLTRQRRRPHGPIEVDKVRIHNSAPIDDAIVRRALSVEPPATFDAATLRGELLGLRALRYFGVMSFVLEGDEGNRELVVTTPPPPYGRGSVQIGLGFSDDFDGNNGYTVTARHQVLPVNRRGGEWQNVVQLGTVGLIDSQFYQPLDTSMRWFVEPSAGFRRELADLWFDGTPVVEYEIESLEARLAAGRVLGRWGEVRATAYTADYRATPKIGSPIFPPDEERRGGVRVDFHVDTVDRVAFPTRGLDLHATYERSSSALGAESPTDLVAARAEYSFSFGRTVITPYLEVGENFEPTADYLNLFKLGGLGRLSGLGDNELLGEKLALGRIVGRYQLTGFRLAGFSFRVFAGLSLEAGNVYSQDESITGSSLRTAWGAFIGADTVLGPLYLGYGRTDDRDRFYLAIGDRF
jgi:NTE family protein